MSPCLNQPIIDIQSVIRNSNFHRCPTSPFSVMIRFNVDGRVCYVPLYIRSEQCHCHPRVFDLKTGMSLKYKRTCAIKIYCLKTVQVWNMLPSSRVRAWASFMIQDFLKWCSILINCTPRHPANTTKRYLCPTIQSPSTIWKKSTIGKQLY